MCLSTFFIASHACTRRLARFFLFIWTVCCLFCLSLILKHLHWNISVWVEYIFCSFLWRISDYRGVNECVAGRATLRVLPTVINLKCQRDWMIYSTVETVTDLSTSWCPVCQNRSVAICTSKRCCCLVKREQMIHHSRSNSNRNDCICTENATLESIRNSFV
jgi:hypothetical protein